MSIHIINLTDPAAEEALPEQVLKQHEAVDGIINNACIIHPFVPVNELSYDKIRQVMDIYFYGMLYMVKTFLPHLLARPVAHITNVTSMAGFCHFPYRKSMGHRRQR